MSLPLDSLGFLVADLARLMRRAFEHRLKESSMTLAQARALVYVQRHEGARQVDLAELLEIQPITLARLVDHLAEAGLVERRADPDDRRAYRVFLTADAAPFLAQIEEVAGKVRAAALAGIDRAEAKAALHVLQAMRENLAPKTETLHPNRP